MKPFAKNIAAAATLGLAGCANLGITEPFGPIYSGNERTEVVPQSEFPEQTSYMTQEIQTALNNCTAVFGTDEFMQVCQENFGELSELDKGFFAPNNPEETAFDLFMTLATVEFEMTKELNEAHRLYQKYRKQRINPPDDRQFEI